MSSWRRRYGFFLSFFSLPLWVHACVEANVMCVMQMVDLKEQIEDEVQAAKEEYVKMESHIRLYINEMEQSMS